MFYRFCWLIVFSLYVLNSQAQNLQEVHQELKTLQKDFQEFRLSTEKRLTAMEAELKNINQRFETVDKRFETVDKSFESVEKRLDMLFYLMLTILAGILGLIGFIVYDRRSVVIPVEKRLVEVEKKEIILEEQYKNIRRIFRKQAEINPQMKEILKEFELL